MRLPVLPMACWRACDVGSVVAVATLLFFERKKKVSLPTINARWCYTGNSLQRLASLGAAGLKRAYRCSRRIVGKPVRPAVGLQWLGCFFLHGKKSFTAHMQRARSIARAGSTRLVLRA
jgi:hypothetical protein